MIDKKNKTVQAEFRHRLLSWFTTHQRPLPWRHTYEPYQVWIAEIMGQQTQMERVVPYFERWVDRFPDVAAVATAPEQAILKAWEGLGYYSRARNIHKAADRILVEANGAIPTCYRQLLDLPGIGPYTAAAILSIAYNQPYPLLDANVERLFARLDDINRPLKASKTRKYLETMATALLDRNDPRHFNQALMELGALICTPKKPACPRCPVQSFCRAYRADTVEFRPLPTARNKRIDINMACGIIQHHDQFFIQQRLADDIWGGLWEFPGGRLLEGEAPEHCVLREVEEETGWRVSDPIPFITVQHQYTRYRVTLHAFICRPPMPLPEPVLTAASRCAWVPLVGLAEYPFPAGHRQVITALRNT